MAPNQTARPTIRQAGFTLVELMVASTILGMTATAAVAMVLNMGILESSGDHARQARLIVSEELEDPRRHYHRYETISPGVQIPDAIDLDAESASPLPASVVMTYESTDINIAGTIVPYKSIRATVSWTEDGTGQSVILFKRIVRLYQ